MEYKCIKQNKILKQVQSDNFIFLGDKFIFQGDDGVGFEGLESAGKCDYAARTASAADSKLFAQQMTQMARMDACPDASRTDCHNTKILKQVQNDGIWRP